jgi:hypothetical protein
VLRLHARSTEQEEAESTEPYSPLPRSRYKLRYCRAWKDHDMSLQCDIGDLGACVPISC